MSNPLNTNGIINNSNNLGTRDGTRVVLREITATLQNSPPMQPGLRNKTASNNPQPGKTEHEVKVQFTREFVDAGAPNSRPESLSSASSFQSLASTLSTKSGIQSISNNSLPTTPQSVANTSYIDAHIPGLDDLIAACGNIQINDDKINETIEETETLQSIADSTLTITATDNSLQSSQNTVQHNLSQEEAFASAINDSNHLNGTDDLTSDYKEAIENTINLNDTREEISHRIDDNLQNLNSELVNVDDINYNVPLREKDEKLITNHIQDSPDIPKSSINNSLINETKDLSLKSDITDGLGLNKTSDFARPPSEQVENNPPEIIPQDCSPSSNSSDNQNSLNQTNEIIPNCNSTFNNLDSSISNVLNLTHDLSNDRKNSSIDCNSENNINTDNKPDQSLNELSANEADGNVSTLNNPLNLPPESNANISTSNIQILNTPDVVVTECSDVNEPLNKEFDSSIVRSVEQESFQDFGEIKSSKNSFIAPDQCVPDSSTDHLPDIISDFVNQTEIIASSLSAAAEIYQKQNIGGESFKEIIDREQAEEISNNHNVSTTAIISVVEPLESSVENQGITESLKTFEPEVLNLTKSKLESEEFKELSICEVEKPVQSEETPEVLKQVEPEVLNLTKPELELEKSKELEPEVLNSTKPELELEKSRELLLPGENPIDLSPKILEQKTGNLDEPVSQVSEKIVPCDLHKTQNSLNSFEEFGESEAEKLPEILINVTPFPGYNIEETDQTSTLNLEKEEGEEGNQKGANTVGQDSSNETITLREDSFHSASSEGASETYNAFQPVKQSTSLNSDCNFKKLELAAQGIAEEIRNKSFEFCEDSDHFMSADPDLFLDGASLDFFLTRNNGQKSVRDLRAESLYVKFDPLVSNVSMLPQGPPQVVDGEENAKNSIPQPTLDTPKRNPALAAIDRLLFYSPATGTPNKVEEPTKIEEKIVKDEAPEAVPFVDEIMAKELELVRSTVLQLESQLEKQKKEHVEELERQRMKYKELELELAREVQKKSEMTMVMDEYEKSLSRHMSDHERERVSFEQEKARLQEELQAANHHLGNTEAAFNDVHSKYERLKVVVSAYRSNEDVLKESVNENVETIKTLEARYEQLKSHAMTQLEKANLELEAIRKQHETETVRLQAMIRKAELKSNSLSEMVDQKSKENKELAEILDEVIARVGRNPE